MSKPAIIGNPRTFSRGKPGPYAINCPYHGKAYLTEAEYTRQMNNAHLSWTCPVMDADPRRFGLCGARSDFDDDNINEWERWHDDTTEGSDRP